MTRTSYLGPIALLTALALGGAPGIAPADSNAIRLHVEGRSSSGRPVLALNLPWDTDKGGSPFNFTKDSCDDVALERLRWAWTALGRMPEGRTITIDTDNETIRAWKRGGYLVLEPQHRDGRNNHHSRVKIPDYIVETILDHDGRLSNRDVERLVRDRGKVTLVKVSSDVGGATVWMDRQRDSDD